MLRYSLKPDLAQIEEAAWAALQSDLQQNQLITATIEIVTGKSVRVDVHGLKVDVPVERLSVLTLSDARPFFKSDQTLQLKILRLEPSAGLIELSNAGTDTDPQKLCEELGQIGEHVRKGTTIKILEGNGLEYALIVEFSHRDRTLQCFIPRHDATFARYAPLSLKYWVHEEVEFILDNFDAEHGRYVGRIAGLVDPWDQIDRYSVGQSAACTIRKITEFHVYCELREGIEGAIYFEELSWGSRQVNEALIRSLTVGRTIDACIIDINKERHTIALSVKRLTKSECEKFFVAFKDKVVRVSVEFVDPGRAHVNFQGGNGVGVLPRRETFFSGDLTRSMHCGQMLDVRLLEYQYRSDNIFVSAKRVVCDEFERVVTGLKAGDIVMGEVVEVLPDRVAMIIHQDVYKLHGFVHKSEVSSVIFCDERVLKRLFRRGEYYQCTVKKIDGLNEAVELSRKGFFRISKETLEYGHPYPVLLLKDNARARWIGYSEQLEGIVIDKASTIRVAEGRHDVMVASTRDIVELTIA